MDPDEAPNPDCDCKIGHAINTYNLIDLNSIIIEHRQESNMSLRDLTTYINHNILEEAIKSALDDDFDNELDLFGALEQEGAVAAIYEVLKNKEESPDRRARVQMRLEQAGIDLNRVENDWVTHPTVRRHLQKCLGVDTSSEKSINQDDASDTIEWTRARCTAVVERTFERLQLANKLKITNPDVTVSIRVTCTKCNKMFSPDQLLTHGCCDCYTN